MRNTKLSEILNYIIFWGLLFLIVFTPLAFGAVQPWSKLIFKMVITILFISWLLKVYAERQLVIQKTLLYIPPLLFIALVLFQVLPIPHSILKIVSFNTYKIHNSVISLLDISRNPTISLNVQSTIAGLLEFICCFIVFFLVINQIKTTKQINLLLSVILVTGFLIAIFAIVQRFSWTGKIYWFQGIPKRSGPFGPFVNYDHFGGYINMIIPIGFGFMLSNIQLPKKILVGFMTVIISTSLMLCRSRGAVLSFVGALIILIFLIFMVRKNYNRKTFLTILASISLTICLIIIFIYWIDWGLFIGRLKEIGLEKNFFNPRISIWRDSFKMVRDFPVFGVGLGNFAHTFPICQTSYVDSFWRHAHNDYLEFTIEMGFLGVLIAFLFFLLFFKQIVRKIRSIHDRYVLGLLIGTMVSIVAMLLHSICDFNLHITSNALLFTILLGLLYSLLRITRYSAPSDIIIIKPESKKAIFISVVIFIGIVFIFIIPPIRQYLAHRYYIKSAFTSGETKSSNLQKAIRLASNNAIYHYELGLNYEKIAGRTENLSKRKFLLRTSEEEFVEAIRLSPTEARYWAQYGWLLGNLGENERAKMVLGRAKELAPFNKEIEGLCKEFLEYRF